MSSSKYDILRKVQTTGTDAKKMGAVGWAVQMMKALETIEEIKNKFIGFGKRELVGNCQQAFSKYLKGDHKSQDLFSIASERRI